MSHDAPRSRIPGHSLWVHRALLWQFSLRAVELRHKGSHLGLLWSVLNPLIMLALYVLVFGYIFGGSFGILPHEGPVDYGLGIFMGLALYGFISDLLVSAPQTIVDNPNFVKKVVFPLEVLPAAHVISACIHLAVTLGLVAAGALLFGRGLPLSCLLLPVVLMPTLMLGLGICWAVSAVGVFLRDLRQVLPALGTGLMFASAVFYPVAKIPPAAWAFLKFNPLLHAITLSRDVFLWGRPLDPFGLAYLYACGLLSMILGYLVFTRLKPAFADVL